MQSINKSQVDNELTLDNHQSRTIHSTDNKSSVVMQHSVKQYSISQMQTQYSNIQLNGIKKFILIQQVGRKNSGASAL